MSKTTRYYVGTDNGQNVVFRKEEEDFKGFRLRICPLLLVGILIGVYLATSWGVGFTGRKSSGTVSPQFTATTHVSSSPINSEGFVFPESSSELIAAEAVLALADDTEIGFEKLLRLAINEIYARHGHKFKTGGVYDKYYQKYDWYKETKRHKVKWSEFTETEQKNLSLFISIEKAYGFR